MNDYLKRLREQRANTWEQAKALLDTATAENRDLTAAEQEQYDRMNADLDGAAEAIRQFEDREQRNREVEEAFDRLLAQPDTEQRSKVDNDLRRFFRGESRSYTAMPDSRDMTTSPDANGGYTVPTTLYGQIVEAMQENSGILGLGVTRIDTASGEPIDVPLVTTGPTASVTSEAAPITESTPVFNVLTLGAAKYAAFIQMSSELAADSAFDLEAYIGRSAGEDCGRKFGAGLHTKLEAGVATGTITSVTADNLIDLLYSVTSPYRNSPAAAWLMNDATIAAVRKLKDTTNQYIWQPSYVSGQPDMLLGKPVATDPNVDSGTGAGKDVVFFGDWSKFFVRMAGGVRFERSDEFAFQNDLISYRAIVRGDGGLADANAIKAITLTA